MLPENVFLGLFGRNVAQTRKDNADDVVRFRPPMLRPTNLKNLVFNGAISDTSQTSTPMKGTGPMSGLKSEDYALTEQDLTRLVCRGPTRGDSQKTLTLTRHLLCCVQTP